MTPLRQTADLIWSAERIAIVTHISPDGDAVGSALALGRGLTKLGKQTILLCDDPVPEKLQFLPDSGSICPTLPEGFILELIIALDSSDAERLGKAGESVLAYDAPLVVIDHHTTNLAYGQVNVVRPDLASTAEVVYQLLSLLGVPPDEDIATCLLAGIVTDTRSFSTPSTTSDTLEVAHLLVQAGADLPYVSNMALNRRSVKMLKLWGLALTQMQWEDGLIWTTLSWSGRQAADVLDADSEGLSNLLLSAEEAHVAAVFLELADGCVDVSMRAALGYDVSEVAVALGGGGHKLAAGCILNGPLGAAVARVLSLLREVAHE